ncbi:MAG TPA: hypothetical protein VHM27_04655 [Rhizomicrobium sp.]|jgi:hypothetical protein|nr:hypothetical protein [Rhizomicrobium sp.]
MRYTITAAALALIACAAPALAQDIPSPQEIIAQNDKNGDGAIDKAEWAASPAPVPFPDEADTNHDGKIDLAELTALFAAFQNGGAPPPPPPQQAAPQG